MGWGFGVTFKGEPNIISAPLCVRDLLWLLTRPTGFTGGGLGLSLQEAQKLTLDQVESLLRPPNKKGVPDNPELEARRGKAEYLEAKIANQDILTSLRMAGEIE